MRVPIMSAGFGRFRKPGCCSSKPPISWLRTHYECSSVTLRRKFRWEFLAPLLDDIALEECYFESRSPANATMSEGCFAIHVNTRRAGYWVTNLVVVAEMFTGGSATIEPAVHGWTIHGAKVAQHVVSIAYRRLGHCGGVRTGEKIPYLMRWRNRVFHAGGSLSQL